MKKSTLFLSVCIALAHTAGAQAQSPVVEFDKIVKEQLVPVQNGAAILVSKKGKVIYEKAIGKANFELNVPMQPNSVFRLASITKQFTAIAILQLMEVGKLNLQDEITRFLPDYPTQGAHITIEHLLTHTSGIRDYTSIKDTVQRSKLDVTPVQMIHYFSEQPMRFAPGSRYEYSNSNYFLLGYIIEKITGNSYGDYLANHFFRPLGMTNSLYADDHKIIANRVSGYTKGPKEIENAQAISMTQPYAAGGILSTVEDLFKWNAALQSYKLVKKETLAKAFTRYKLTGGRESNYGYGFRFGFIQESPSIWHGGLIDGFFTMAMYLPKEDVYVVVLTNCDCASPEVATAKLAAAAIGKPYDVAEVRLAPAVLKQYEGIYENEAGDQLHVGQTQGKLTIQRGNSPKTSAKAFSQKKFSLGDALITMEFVTTSNAQIEQLIIKTRNGNEVWKKSEKSLATQTEMKLDEKTLDLYTGTYEVTPEFTFVITRENNRLFLKAEGQEKVEMYAAAPGKFFLKVNDARFEFISESGKITKVSLSQGGRTTDARRIK